MSKLQEHRAGEELVKELQKGLLGWYDFPKDARIYYYGETADEALEDGAYDYVISNADIEKYEEPKQLLEECRRLLKPDGRLLLAANNRYGIRYFCGDRDPYTERSFDGVEGYARAYSKKEDVFAGRCYARAELKAMLRKAGFVNYQFYSVFNGLDNPCLLYREDYLPNEDLANRLFPTYHYPDAVFLEERLLYRGLVENDMFHQMANAYLIECTPDQNAGLCSVQHVTSSIERGKEKAVYTIIYDTGMVEKRAVYPEGKDRLKKLYQYGEELKEHGIKVVDGTYQDGCYRMPYVNMESGQLYLKRLLHEDVRAFLDAMDRFRDTILASSELVCADKGDGEGAVLRYGNVDLVPLNSFYDGTDFVFYDQEFREEDYPANVLIWRMVATFYAGDMEAGKILPMDTLLERYDLKRNLKKWQSCEWEFLAKLRNEEPLAEYHKRVRANREVVYSNRQRMNYSAEKYQKLFVDIFHHADTRKLILFGSGNFAKKFLMIYGKDYPVYAILDNRKENWGKELDGIKIQSPDILKELSSGEYKVIICIKNYLSVMKQLDEMGVGEYSIYDWNQDYPRPLKAPKKAEKNENDTPKKYHIGYVAGAFDMFHAGHLNLLKKAKEQCDYLIAGVIADETIYKKKKKNPVIPLADRVEIVASCRYVDQAEPLPADYNGIVDAYRMFHFDAQFSGDDHGNDEAWLKDKEYLNSQGADIVFFPYTKRVSSTKLRKDIGIEAETPTEEEKGVD